MEEKQEKIDASQYLSSVLVSIPEKKEVEEKENKLKSVELHDQSCSSQ